MSNARTCADAAVQQLCAAGLDTCFANPGTTEMFLVSALESSKSSIRSILCLHEAVCTGACDGYARLAGRPAVSLLHLGPGLGNGLCNLHNAHRARSPVLVLVGEHATWHSSADPPLAQDIQRLASTVSGHVLTITAADTVGSTMQQALDALARPTAPASSSSSGEEGTHKLEVHASTKSAAAIAGTRLSISSCCPSSRVVTVVFPHDISWEPAPNTPHAAPGGPLTAASPSTQSHQAKCSQQHISWEAPQGPKSSSVSVVSSPAVQSFLTDCAAALRAAPHGKAALVLGGAALLTTGNALSNAGRLAAALGASLLCDPLPGRISRGAGLPHCRRLPYFPQEAAAELAKYDVLLLLDIRRPVAMFGYKDGPSQLLSQPDDNIWELDSSLLDVSQALQYLLTLVPGASDIRPCVNCAGLFASNSRPQLPTGRLTAAALCQAVAALQPADAVLVDESLTSGNTYWEASKGCPAFDHLCLTGGSIGSGPPMATGAAVAAPERQVINVQADGSAMYTLQALWTQARENLKVLTVICANNTYAILKVEAMRQRTGQANSLTSLAGPTIDWVALATGMGVPAGRAETCEQLTDLIQRGLKQQGPFLIHAALA